MGEGGTMGRVSDADGAERSNGAHLINQWGGGDINGPEQVGGEVGGVVAQALARSTFPTTSGSVEFDPCPAMAAGNRARQHTIARAYALDIPIVRLVWWK